MSSKPEKAEICQVIPSFARSLISKINKLWSKLATKTGKIPKNGTIPSKLKILKRKRLTKYK